MKKLNYFILCFLLISSVNAKNITESTSNSYFSYNSKTSLNHTNDIYSLNSFNYKKYSFNNQMNANSLLSSNSSKDGGVKYGYIAGPVVLGLSIAAEITKQEQIPTIPLGATATLITILSVPLISSNATSLSHEWQKVKTASWVAYGGGLLCAGILISTGIMELTPPTPIITTTGVLCATSIVLMTHCTKHSGTVTTNHIKRKLNINYGITPLKNGGLCSLSLQF